MKQLITSIFLTIALISVSFAQKEWVGFTSNQPKNPEFRLTQSTIQQVKFVVQIPGFFKETINSGGISYARMELFDFYSLLLFTFPSTKKGGKKNETLMTIFDSLNVKRLGI